MSKINLPCFNDENTAYKIHDTEFGNNSIGIHGNRILASSGDWRTDSHVCTPSPSISDVEMSLPWGFSGTCSRAPLVSLVYRNNIPYEYVVRSSVWRNIHANERDDPIVVTSSLGQNNNRSIA